MEQDLHQRQRDKVQKKDQQYRNKIEKRVSFTRFSILLMMSGTEVDFGQEMSDTLTSAESKPIGTIEQELLPEVCEHRQTDILNENYSIDVRLFFYNK